MMIELVDDDMGERGEAGLAACYGLRWRGRLDEVAGVGAAGVRGAWLLPLLACALLCAVAPARAGDADNSLRVMTGAGLKAELWTAFQQRFGVEAVFEGLGSTEGNFGITNVDNCVGSVGRLPYPQHSNIKFLRYDVEADDHVRGADGRP